uniref:Uncharacterized protein LOC103337512 n=1 Tax=Rhizophora mucronata TaxID=61149 RepID=A0A2P2JN41_RHIMU
MLLQVPAFFTRTWSAHSVPCLLPSHYCRQNPIVLNGHVSLTVTHVPSRRGRRRRTTVWASNIDRDGGPIERRRKVVEHICLLKAKGDLSEEDEKDMLDFLYTSQYQMRGIVAVSLGRISNDNAENYTHAIYMRFQRKEDVAKFYENPFYLGILKEHVLPYCQGLVNVDYESEVEDDLLSIFRKGEVQILILAAKNIHMGS